MGLPKCNTSGTTLDKQSKNRNQETISSTRIREKVSMTSGGVSKLFNVQNQKFYVITWSKYSFSEFYRTDVKAWKNIIDFFGNWGLLKLKTKIFIKYKNPILIFLWQKKQ